MGTQDREKRPERKKDESDKADKAQEKPAEPRSPGAAVAATNAPAGGSLNDRAMPGESQLPRREDMKPQDHAPRKEEDDREQSGQ